MPSSRAYEHQCWCWWIGGPTVSGMTERRTPARCARSPLRRRRAVDGRRRGGVHAAGPETFDLVPRVEGILEAERSGAFAELVSPELFESLVEFHTPVCRHVADVERELRRLRAHAVGSAAAQGASARLRRHTSVQPLRAPARHGRERYRALIDVLQYAGRRELIFGLHVHVAVDDPDRAIRVMGALAPHLCELVALSANSPFWRGQPTGFASCRHLIFAAFPRSGPPPRFENYAEYARVVGELVECGCIEDYTRIWWDIRPHPRFGHVEVRVMDAVSRVDDAVALAAYVQALVRRLCSRGGPATRPQRSSGAHAREQVARRALRAPGHPDRSERRRPDPRCGADRADARRARAAFARARLRQRDRRRPPDPSRRQRRRPSAAVYGATADTVHVTRDVVEITRGGGAPRRVYRAARVPRFGALGASACSISAARWSASGASCRRRAASARPRCPVTARRARSATSSALARSASIAALPSPAERPRRDVGRCDDKPCGELTGERAAEAQRRVRVGRAVDPDQDGDGHRELPCRSRQRLSAVGVSAARQASRLHRRLRRAERRRPVRPPRRARAAPGRGRPRGVLVGDQQCELERVVGGRRPAPRGRPATAVA